MKKMIDLAGEIPALERTNEGKLRGGFGIYLGGTTETLGSGFFCTTNKGTHCRCSGTSTEEKTTGSTTKAKGASLCLGGSALF